MQGLYDMNGGLEPANVSDFHNESGVICPLVTLGDYFTNWPCMSTGVMFVRATPGSYAAISAMVIQNSFLPLCTAVFCALVSNGLLSIFRWRCQV